MYTVKPHYFELIILNSPLFELIILSLHLKSIPLFRNLSKTEYVHKSRAQLETYCILFELVLYNW